MKKLFIICVFLVGCAHTPQPLPPVITGSQILLPKAPDLKDISDRTTLPEGSRIMPKGKQPLSVGKGGGAYFPKITLDALYENFINQDWYVSRILRQVQVHNESLDKMRNSVVKEKKSWWSWGQ